MPDLRTTYTAEAESIAATPIIVKKKSPENVCATDACSGGKSFSNCATVAVVVFFAVFFGVDAADAFAICKILAAR